MQIIELRAENFKRLSAVQITPDGALVTVAGMNGQGKSSCLDAIWAALGGKGVIDPEPIRHGQTKATIRIDLGEIVVTRTFRTVAAGEDYTTTLVIQDASGNRKTEGQTLLDQLVGDLSFDPLAFEHAKPDERFDMVRALLPDVDFDGVEKANALDYEERTVVNRKAKEARARAEAIVADMGVGDALKDLDALNEELSRARETNAQIETRRVRRQNAEDQMKEHYAQARRLQARAEALRKEIEDVELEAERHRDAATEMQRKLEMADPLPEEVDVEHVRSLIETAKVHNAKVEARQRRIALWQEVKQFETDSETLTDKIERRKADLARQISESKFPVPGISFEGKAVYLGGVPFVQASDAERLRASVRIAMAANPKLRVIRIREGSRLDENGLRVLGEIAAANGFQIWIERVGREAGATVIIEDGHVAGQDPAIVGAELEADTETKRRRRTRAIEGLTAAIV